MALFIMGDETPIEYRSAEANGYIARDFVKFPYGSIPGVPAGEVAIVPMEEWPDRIADKERTKSSLRHIWEDSGIGILDQNGYPFCHGFAALMTVLMHRAKQGLPYVELSASSIAAPVTGYRKAGAWIGDDLKQIVNVGVAPLSLIPMLTYKKADFPPGWEQVAAQYKVTEFTDLRSRDFVQQGSALLQNHVVSVGQSYWGHAVPQFALRDLNNGRKATDHNRYGVDLPNSWGENWGDRGWVTQTGSKKFADDAYICPQVKA